MKVFVDTSAWLALYDDRDEHYRAAQHIAARLKSQGTDFLLSDFVFSETLTLVRYRVGHAAAVQFGRRILSSQLAQLILLEESGRRQAWQIFQRYDDKDFSFTDCTSFAIMERLGVKTAFAFDRDFRQYGFEVLGAGQ